MQGWSGKSYTKAMKKQQEKANGGAPLWKQMMMQKQKNAVLACLPALCYGNMYPFPGYRTYCTDPDLHSYTPCLRGLWTDMQHAPCLAHPPVCNDYASTCCHCTRMLNEWCCAVRVQ